MATWQNMTAVFNLAALFQQKDFYFSKICYFLYSWTASLGVKESSICSTNVQLIVYTQYYKDKRDNICNIIKSGHQAIDS